MKALAPALIVCLASVGCASGLSMSDMHRELANQRLEFSNWDVKRIEQIRPQLNLPMRIVVAPPCGYRQWTKEEKEIFSDCERELRREGIVSEIILMPNLVVEMSGGYPYHQQNRMQTLRRGAARYRADALLVLNAVTDTDKYANILSVLNLTIVGMLVVPGHHAEAATVMEGLLIDNRNEFLYMSAMGEGKGHNIQTLVNWDVEPPTETSRTRALQSLLDAFTEEAKGFARHYYRPRVYRPQEQASPSQTFQGREPTYRVEPGHPWEESPSHPPGRTYPTR